MGDTGGQAQHLAITEIMEFASRGDPEMAADDQDRDGAICLMRFEAAERVEGKADDRDWSLAEDRDLAMPAHAGVRLLPQGGSGGGEIEKPDGATEPLVGGSTKSVKRHRGPG